MTLQGDQLPARATGDREIEQVLLGLADGSYVLSTPDGAVAECGIGVVGLLGVPADRLVGRPTADVLVAGADDGVRSAFERLLLADGADVAARRTFPAQTAAGTTRSLQFVVVAVPLALGWEFTSLLSELGSRDPGTWHPEALRLRHGRALEAIEGVVRSGRQPDPSARLAGILIVVRDVDAPPLTREDVDRRMAEQRSAARAAAADAARRTDEAAGRLATPGATSTGQLPGLEDLVERARVLRERLEEAEHDAATAKIERDEALGRLSRAEAEREAAAARATTLEAAADDRTELLAAERDELRAQLERARRELESAGAEVDSTRAQAESARAEAESARAGADLARAETESGRADAERARAELHALRDALDAERAAHSESTDAEVVALRADLDAARAALHTRTEELAGARAELDARSGELGGARGELEARDRELRAVRAELSDARAQADETSAELGALRAQLDRSQAELDAALVAARDVRAEREQVRIRAQQLFAEAERARAAADAIRAEFAFDADPPAADDPVAGADARPDDDRPWSAPAPLDPAPAAALPAPTEPPLALPEVEAGRAAALIGLDGTFKRLDEAFCSLLGCREEELRAARWPSIIDRENLAAHEELARALKAGEIDRAEIETVYMHAQGLLVPIAGTVSMHRGDPSGEPTHFLFCADVSRTAGAPGII